MKFVWLTVTTYVAFGFGFGRHLLRHGVGQARQPHHVKGRETWA